MVKRAFAGILIALMIWMLCGGAALCETDTPEGLCAQFHGYDAEAYRAAIDEKAAQYRRAEAAFGSVEDVATGYSLRFDEYEEAEALLGALLDSARDVMGIGEEEYAAYSEMLSENGAELIDSELYAWAYDGKGIDPGTEEGIVESDEYYLFELYDSEGGEHSVIAYCETVFNGGDNVSFAEIDSEF